MGAYTFETTGSGKTAELAFKRAVKQAQYDHGHSGYSGTIAEKCSFVLIPVPDGEDARAFAGSLVDKDDPRITDKWGPAGCIKLGDDKWLFFGRASS